MTCAPQSSSNCADWMVDRHVRAGRGDCVALVECGGDGRRALTYAQLLAASIHMAETFRAMTAGRSEPARIGIVGSSTFETVCAWLGAMRAGCLPCVMHPALGADAHARLAADFRPDAIFRDRTGPAGVGVELRAICHAEASMPTSAGMTPALAVAPGDPAFCLASSGSTGRAKLCAHAHGAIPGFDHHVTRPLWKMHAGDVVLGSSGPYFSFGLQGIHTALSLGARAILLPEWTRHEAFLETIEREAVTVFLAVPTLFHLLMTRASRRYRTGSLRFCLSAGERLPDVIRTRWSAFAGAPLVDSVGTTESFLPYFTEVPGEPPGLRETGAFRYAYAVADRTPGDKAAMAVSLAGSLMMLGYLEPGGDVRQLRQPSWFATGDLFSSVAGGWSFLSRCSERVKIAGHWVSPQGLESFLLTDERVLQAAAVPVTTEGGLQRLRAFIVLGDAYRDGDAVVAALMRRMRDELKPRALRPDRIEIVSGLASSPNGKLRRRELAAAVAGRRIGAQRGVVPI